MCMRKPSHIYFPGQSASAVAITEDYVLQHPEIPYDVYLDNLKLHQLKHVEFDPSEFLPQYTASEPPAEYQFHSSYPRENLDVESMTEKMVSDFHIDEKLSAAGLPLPVTASSRTSRKLRILQQVGLIATITLIVWTTVPVTLELLH